MQTLATISEHWQLLFASLEVGFFDDSKVVEWRAARQKRVVGKKKARASGFNRNFQHTIFLVCGERRFESARCL